jgi:ssRNA-specific RNase YbeY (16S rRNA maturation enzyme)
VKKKRISYYCHYFCCSFRYLRDAIRSELGLLENDMRILRDAVIAREEAWDQAKERERNCQQHLARLTAEAITARHLCETRQDELRAVTEALTVITEIQFGHMRSNRSERIH